MNDDQIFFPAYRPADLEWGMVCTVAGRQQSPAVASLLASEAGRLTSINFETPFDRDASVVHQSSNARHAAATPYGRYSSSQLTVRNSARYMGSNVYNSRYAAPAEGIESDDYQMVYITAGHGWYRSESAGELEVTEGSVIFVFPNERHSFLPDPETGWSEMWVGFKGGAQTDTMVSMITDRKSPIVRIGTSDTICDCYNRILTICTMEGQGRQEAICGFISSILGYVRYKHINFSVSTTRNIDKIQRAQALLRESLMNNLSPADIAEQLGMSYSLLREQFKKSTGMSMSDYAINARHNLAKTLLSTSDKTIKEIAFETGFESMSRFCSSFRQHVGITASDFRKKNRR